MGRKKRKQKQETYIKNEDIFKEIYMLEALRAL